MNTDKKSEDKETTYQVYTSSMQAHKLIMPCGKVLHVIKGEFITCRQDEIDYIDNEIKLGFKYLKKGGTTTSATADPMAAMKKKIAEQAVKDYLAKEIKEANAGGVSKTPTATQAAAVSAPVVTPTEAIKPANTIDLSALKQQFGK